jgi:maltose O-acetyltransferase
MVALGLGGAPFRAATALAGAAWNALARRHCAAGTGTRVLLGGRIVNAQPGREAITVGDNCWIAGQLLVFPHGGRIRMGSFCYVGEDTRIWSAEEIAIGDRVFIAHGVNVHDNDAHSLSAAERHRHFRELVTAGRASFTEDVRAGRVVIGNDVWVGFNATVLKGVTIGDGAIVGAGAVVVRDVEPYAVVAGNPAVVVAAARP